MKLRFSLTNLLTLIAFVAIAVACFAKASSDSSSAVLFNVTIVVLLSSIPVAVFGRNKPFWSGFAICGWGYLVVAYLNAEPFKEGLSFGYPLVTVYRWLDLSPRVNVISMLRIGDSLMALSAAYVGGMVSGLAAHQSTEQE